MLIRKGKCDAEGCGREFNTETGGFEYNFHVDEGVLHFAISRIDASTNPDATMTCGKECLMKVISMACDEHLGVTSDDGERKRNGFVETVG